MGVGDTAIGAWRAIDVRKAFARRPEQPTGPRRHREFSRDYSSPSI